jgi:putative nucleotidyltransferase with HDIG domain
VVEPGSDGEKALHSVRVTEARQLFDTLERASQDRVRSATRVEELLDQGRAGPYSSQGIESVVEEIVARGSAPAMKAIAGLKGSDQTYAHCSDMSVILMESYCEMLMRQGKEASDQTRRFVLMAGFLHDIGKSEVPKEILDSTVRFAPDSREMQIMRNHATYGARILTEMGMHPATINVAHYHHVKRDTALFASYPAVPYDQVLPLTRLAAIVDVYQALIGKRRYKKNWVSGKAIEYLRALRATEFDEAILDNYVASIGVYPVGTLVRLNTKELAFVVSAGPHGNAARPLVVPVEDASGERLTHHRLTDLMLELDLQVEEVVDHYEHYNQSDDQAYEVFQSIRIAA